MSRRRTPSEEERAQFENLITCFTDKEQLPEPPNELVEMNETDTDMLRKVTDRALWYKVTQGWEHYFRKHSLRFIWRFLYEYQRKMPRRCPIGDFAFFRRVKAARDNGTLLSSVNPPMQLVVLLLHHVIRDPDRRPTGDNLPDSIRPGERAQWRNCRSLGLLRELSGDIDVNERRWLWWPEREFEPYRLHITVGAKSTPTSPAGSPVTVEVEMVGATPP